MGIGKSGASFGVGGEKISKGATVLPAHPFFQRKGSDWKERRFCTGDAHGEQVTSSGVGGWGLGVCVCVSFKNIVKNVTPPRAWSRGDVTSPPFSLLPYVLNYIGAVVEYCSIVCKTFPLSTFILPPPQRV